MGRFTIVEAQLSERYRILAWLICIIGALFYCYEYLLRIAPSVMATELMQSFHLGTGQLGDLSAFFYYVYMPLQLFVGVLMDRYGPRRLLMLACLSCVLGSFLFGQTHYFAVAALGRGLIGLGAAFAFVGALKLATIWLPPERFALVSGLITSLGMIGAMIGDVFMAELVSLHGWRFASILLAYAGLGLIVIILLIVRDRVKTTQAQPMFLPELSFYDVFAGLLQAIRHRDIWINGAIGCLLYLPVTAFAELWGVPYLIQAHHLSHVEAASVNAMIFLGWAVGGPLAGWLSDLVRRRRLPLMLGAFVAILVACYLIYVPYHSVAALYCLFFVLGVATSVQVLVFAVGREISPKHIAATSISLTNMFTMIGGAVFQPIVGVLLDLFWKGHIAHGVRLYPGSAYTAALSVLPVGLILALFLSYCLKETHAFLSE